MRSRSFLRGAIVLALLTPAGAVAQGVAIQHDEIGCIVAGQYPKMNACFAPASLVKKARVYFRPETLPTWYYVEMTSDAPCFSGVLLKPSKALIDKKIFYYLDVQGGGTGRTQEYGPVVVRSAEECRSKLPVAPLSQTGPAAVFPSIPAGFVGAGGLSTGVIAGGVAGAALIGGGAVLLTEDDDGPAVTAPPTVPVTSPPVTAPPPTLPSPSTGVPSPLLVACQAAPRSGNAPLRVDFATFPNGGTGSYEFEWSFGDGGSSNNPNPAHTFLSPGVFNATVRVTSGALVASCSRSITVTAPPTAPPPTAPPPSPPTSFKLRVSLAGAGTGVVTGPGITCPGDCEEFYAPGTVVTLSAAPTGLSFFAGWSGDCTGTAACTVTMSADRAVTAQFALQPVLTVTKSGTGTGTVTGSGINCGADCTESYAPGTLVTLTATPTGGSTFTGWSGACTGAGTCTVTMDVSKTVNAQFDLQPVLTVTKSGTGTGTVTGSGINCGADCTETYPPGTVVTLTATPTGGSTFAGWTGACTGAGTCTVTMDTSKAVNAQFDAPRAVTLTFTSTDAAGDCNGPPSVNIDPPRALCVATPAGTTCTHTYAAGTTVQVISSTNCGATVCWSGACTGTPEVLGSVCTLTMSSDLAAGATFKFSSCGVPAIGRSPVLLSWSTHLDAAGGVGHVVVDGRLVVAASGRRVQAMAGERAGEAVVAATLVEAAGRAGTWRFEASDGQALEAGSLRVLRGEVIQLTPTAVVFRLKGLAGEQVAFSYRSRR